MRPAIAWAIKQKEKAKKQVEKVARDYPAYFYTLIYIFGANLALPIFDVPLLGLSLTAPIFFVIAAFVIFRPASDWFKQQQGWIILGLSLLSSIVISTLVNEMNRGEINRSSLLSLVQYAYWIVVFVIMGYIFRSSKIRKTMSTIFAFAVVAITALRLYEALFHGRIGAWSGTTIMSQNSYGFQFSVFVPFLYIKLFDKETKKRWFWVLVMLATIVAVGLNGSRGNWVAMAIGAAVMALVFMITQPKRVPGFILAILAILVVGFFVLNLSSQTSESFNARFQTLFSLDEDKTYVVRQLLVQKGFKLFEESPIIGVGSERFSREKVALEIPDLLRYSDTDFVLSSKQSHNSYIQFLAEFGLLGSIPLAMMLIYLAVRGFQISYEEMKEGKFIGLAIFISFIQMSAHMWVLSSFTGTLTWAVYGMLVGAIISFDAGRKKST
ncbi:MAG: O-antigen ligase family protein [Anaerolineaceae bacterium]|nr:O-antigen ligase family protein [Anaerolineaceae bacterium]